MNRHERRAAAASDRTSGQERFTVRCTVCGSETHVIGELGPPRRLTVEHEDACEFYRAIEAGQGEAWVLANGYPIRTEGPGRTLALLVNEATGEVRRPEDVGPDRRSN
jgi:hypothetical protein